MELVYTYYRYGIGHCLFSIRESRIRLIYGETGHGALCLTAVFDLQVIVSSLQMVVRERVRKHMYLLIPNRTKRFERKKNISGRRTEACEARHLSLSIPVVKRYYPPDYG